MGEPERGSRFDEATPARTGERAKSLAPPRDPERTRDAFFAEAGAVLGASLDVRVTARALASLAVPALGQEAVVDLRDGERHVRRFVATTDFVSEDPVPVEDDAASRDALLDEGRSSVRPGELRAPLTAGGQTLGVLTVFADRRVWTAAERALVEELAHRGALALDHARQHESMREALRRREEALVVVAQELRAPLTAMTVQATRLLHELSGQPHSTRKLADTLRRSADRLRHLAQDLLDLDQIDSGRLALHKRHHDAAELVGEVLELMQPLAAEKGLLLETSILHHRAVPCDRERFLQVLTTAIGSAIGLAPTSSTLAISVRSLGRDALFRVTDGGGIPVADRGRVFDRLWQGTDRAAIGLALAVAKGIVEAHGGQAWVEPDDTVTALCFSLPTPDSTRPGRREPLD